MAEIAGDFLGPVLEVVRWVSAPILRQFKYLCCFTTNITNLEKEAKKLQDTDGDLQLKVDAAKRDVQIIYSEVETWLENSKNIKDETDGILNEVPNVEGGCLNLRARFSLSRRAKKTTDRLKELRDQCKFNDNAICHPRPPPAREIILSETFYEFESRKKIEEDIMATLRDGDVNMMGIYGMGGLGKTTMAKKIKNRALGEHVFEEVAMVVVSQPIDKLKIQLEIGGSLGLKLEEETSQAAKVQKLHKRLSGTERTLVILDDVWETLELEDLGIPHGYEGCTCTILLTSRSRDVLSGMDVQNIFGMQLLSEEDSWSLFEGKVGTRVDDTEFNSIAKEVVKECGRLPIALITVGAALKDKVHVSAWRNALRQLKRHDPDIPDFIKKVYNPLELSYDVLEHKYQLVFLLCCLYPEDADIPLERLTYFCMGLRLFEGGLVEERDRMHSLIDVLKDRSLLLDSNKGDDYVRMHDVVRDVCIFIARKNKYISGGDSSLQRYEFDPGYALLQIRNSTNKEIKFDGIRDLYVLSIERCLLLTSLPFTQRPNNLITLVLDSCRKLEEICDDRISSNSFQNLKILKLDNLPVLKQLWMSSQNDLGKDFLPQLEVLDIRRCGMMETVFLWKGEDGNENTSSHHITKIFPKLKELQLWSLPNLISLCQGIEGIEFPLMRKLDISICEKMKGMVWNENNSGGSSSKASIQGLFCPREVSFGLLKKLDTDRNSFSELEELKIFGCQSILSLFTSSMAGNLVNLKELSIEWCKEMVEVIKDDEEKGMSGGRQTALLFPKLQKLELWNLPKLVSFCESKEIEIPVLRNYENQTALLFPKLQNLILRNLPKLVSFCESKGIESIQFLVLRSMEIRGCGKMKGMVANGVTSNENNSGGSSTNASDTIHLFCQSKQVSFGWLKKLDTDRNSFSELEELKISGCQSILSLFTSSMAGNLVNLKELRIEDCFEMVEVIKDDEEKGVSGGRQTALLFPKLEIIMLRNLPKLVVFCEWKCDVELPSLRKVEINFCRNMKSCTAGLLTTPNLKSVKIDREEEEDEEEEEEEEDDDDDDNVKDLNGLVQQQYLNGLVQQQYLRRGEEEEEEEEEDNDDDDVKYLNGLVQQGFSVGVATVREASRGRRRRRRRGRGRGRGRQ